MNVWNKKSIDCILIDIGIDQLYERRMADHCERILDKDHIRQELAYNKQYFYEYCKYIPCTGHIITNDATAAQAAEKIITLL